jgi:hypothetical protein
MTKKDKAAQTWQQIAKAFAALEFATATTKRSSSDWGYMAAVDFISTVSIECLYLIQPGLHAPAVRGCRARLHCVGVPGFIG